MYIKYLIITILSLIISVILGIISNDLIIGGTVLLTGLLCAFLLVKAKE